MSRSAAALAAVLGLGLSVARIASGEQEASYRATGADVRLFDQYDNDGYSLSVAPGPPGVVTLEVRVSDAPLESRAPFPTGAPYDPALTRSRERDAFARGLVSGVGSQSAAVERLIVGIAARVRYDPDALHAQDPEEVFRSRRGSCVGFAELAVDLLRRVGIPARTVQGILRTEPGSGGYDPALGGSYHRWIEIYYPDRGYVFSDPSASINGVDARYLPFSKRSLRRPRSLGLVPVARSGALRYGVVHAGAATLRARPTR